MKSRAARWTFAVAASLAGHALLVLLLMLGAGRPTHRPIVPITISLVPPPEAYAPPRPAASPAERALRPAPRRPATPPMAAPSLLPSPFAPSAVPAPAAGATAAAGGAARGGGFTPNFGQVLDCVDLERAPRHVRERCQQQAWSRTSPKVAEVRPQVHRDFARADRSNSVMMGENPSVPGGASCPGDNLGMGCLGGDMSGVPPIRGVPSGPEPTFKREF